MRNLLDSGSQRLQLVYPSRRLIVDAGFNALGYYFGRAVGLMEPARRAHQRFEVCDARRSAMLCIYRERNAASVTDLVEQAEQRGMSIALWALDKPLA